MRDSVMLALGSHNSVTRYRFFGGPLKFDNKLREKEKIWVFSRKPSWATFPDGYPQDFASVHGAERENIPPVSGTYMKGGQGVKSAKGLDPLIGNGKITGHVCVLVFARRGALGEFTGACGKETAVGSTRDGFNLLVMRTAWGNGPRKDAIVGRGIDDVLS